MPALRNELIQQVTAAAMQASLPAHILHDSLCVNMLQLRLYEVGLHPLMRAFVNAPTLLHLNVSMKRLLSGCHKRGSCTVEHVFCCFNPLHSHMCWRGGLQLAAQHANGIS